MAGRTALAVAVLWSSLAVAQTTWTPPPEPLVPPQLPRAGELDVDANGVDDKIDQELAETRAALQTETAPERRAALGAVLAAPIRVEVVFARQVTQYQIDAFLALGGEIDHLYQTVSYGWNGRLPRSAIESLPGLMGPSFVIVAGERPAKLHLDEATRTGRVRPVWASGFAGSASGFSGSSDITIAILDTGIDDSHTDLAGRMEFWKDYTSDGEPTPRDIGQHGSHVTGIALGTGASFGLGPGTLTYTDSGDLTGVPKDSGFVNFINLPAASVTYTQNATWVGGGSASLFGTFRAHATSGNLSALSAPTTGTTGIVESNTFTASDTTSYTGFLPQTGTIGRYAIVNTVTNYPAVGDGFNALRGVSALSRWAGAKVFTNAGMGSNLDADAAMDDMVAQRIAHNIKVANMSFGTIGTPGIDTTERAKVNTMVNNGIVVTVSAGNDGPGTGPGNEVDDPGRAALVLTVAASNDVNELTQYTSSGFLSPGPDEDNKPDVMAPGGSDFYSNILSVDSNDADAESATFADRVPNDYFNIKGTSMAAPFAAGASSLVIEALQAAGRTWTFSSADALIVKMLLCASATESNAAREVASGFDPTLGRAAAPKDRFEGYGIINPDAAIEAVTLSYACEALSDSTAGGRFDRRAWGRKLALTSGAPVALALIVPPSADYDLYVYSATPDAKGNPVILGSSTNAGLGTGEALSFRPNVTETGYLFVKRVSGSGMWSLSCGTPTSPVTTTTTTTIPPCTNDLAGVRCVIVRELPPPACQGVTLPMGFNKAIGRANALAFQADNAASAKQRKRFVARLLQVLAKAGRAIDHAPKKHRPPAACATAAKQVLADATSRVH